MTTASSIFAFHLRSAFILLLACFSLCGCRESSDDSLTTSTNNHLAQQAFLKGSGAAAYDNFGWSLALSGDTLAVGAHRKDNSTGAVYIFTRSGTSWTEQARLRPTDVAAGDVFGANVALVGDTLVVGAPYKNSGAGAVYVFSRSGTNWTEQACLTASNAAANDNFGSSLALSGDTLAVGAFGKNSNAGAAYVFSRSGTSWTEQARLTALNAAANDNFGSSLALSGNTLAVGAPIKDTSTGAVYVFNRSGTNWTEQACLTASNAATYNCFGCSLGLSGGTLAVGAWGKDSSSGAAYIFICSGGAWSEQACLTASNAEATDYFGYSVSLSGDVLAVGAIREDSGGSGPTNNSTSDSGAAYVFSRSGGVWTERDYLKASNAAANSLFGYCVALDGNSLAVGAIYEDSNASDSGAVYLFR